MSREGLNRSQGIPIDGMFKIGESLIGHALDAIFRE
jgi:hypothetical protein